MKRLFLLISSVLLISCGSPEVEHKCKVNGHQVKTNDYKLCNVRVESGKDGQNGANGVDGSDGQDGKDGLDGANGADGRDGLDGVNGADGLDGANGADGRDGLDGVNGADGLDGLNGTDGKDGADGESPIPIEVIDPCGDNPNVIDEVILRMPDGKLLASFSDNEEGRNTRFSVLPEGTFMTTDGSRCVFTVSNGNVSF
jgi:hypothetical protein